LGAAAGEPSRKAVQGRFRCGPLVRGDPKHADRPVDIFDPMFPLILKRYVGVAAKLIANTARHVDLPRLGQSFEASGNIDAVAVNISFVDDHVAGVDADAQLYSLIVILQLAGSQFALDFDAAAHRVDGAVELDQHPVAHGPDQAAAMLGHRRVDQILNITGQPKMRAFFVGAHQSAVADDVGQQDGGQSAFQMDVVHPDHPNSLTL
jgi:hypothetical protein